MAFLNDRVYDNGLGVFNAEANRIDICSALPSTYAQATNNDTGLSLGNKTSYTVGAPASGSPNGRQVTAASVTDGDVSKTGTASHWAITDTGNSRLLAAGSLSSSQAVTQGNTWTIGAFTISIAAPA